MSNLDKPVLPDIASRTQEDCAADIIKNLFRRLVAIRRVRILYANSIDVLIDETTSDQYYSNPKTGVVSWSLPSFMDGKLDHTLANDDDSDQDSDEESSDDGSDDSERKRKKRLKSRKQPR